jgi:hypothetical protein
MYKETVDWQIILYAHITTSIQLITNNRRLFLLSIKLLLKFLNGNGGIGRHTVVLGGFLDLLLHVNSLVSDRWVDNLYYQRGISENPSILVLLCN